MTTLDAKAVKAALLRISRELESLRIGTGDAYVRVAIADAERAVILAASECDK